MLCEWLASRVLELTYTAYDLKGFAEDCDYTGEPFRWDEERRFLLRCELDAAYFHLYGIGREDVDYILETFPIVRVRMNRCTANTVPSGSSWISTTRCSRPWSRARHIKRDSTRRPHTAGHRRNSRQRW